VSDEQLIDEREIRREMRKLRHYLLRWRRDPVAYVIEACNGTPTDRQAEILRSLAEHRFCAVRSGRGAGKTRMVAWAVAWFTDTMWEPDTQVKVVCIGPTGATVEDALWGELGVVQSNKPAWLRKHFELISARYHWTEGPHDVFATLRTARKDNSESLQGVHGKTMFLLDEASGLPDEWIPVIMGSTTDEHSYCMMTGNPTRLSGYFWKVFNRPGGTWQLHHIDSAQSLTTQPCHYYYTDPLGRPKRVDTTGRVTPDFLNRMQAEFGKDTPAAHVHIHGNFAEALDAVVIDRALLTSIAQRAPVDQTGRARVAGVDVAWMGGDASTLVIRHGTCIEHMQEWHGMDPTESADIVEHAIAAFRAENKPVDSIVVDIIGMGAGTYSALRRRGLPVVKCDVHTEAPGGYVAQLYRLRDWLWWRARDFFRSSEVHLGPELNLVLWDKCMDELSAPTFRPLPSGKTQIEPKIETRKRIGRSPDIADGLLLTLLKNWDELIDGRGRARRLLKPKHPASWKVV